MSERYTSSITDLGLINVGKNISHYNNLSQIQIVSRF